MKHRPSLPSVPGMGCRILLLAVFLAYAFRSSSSLPGKLSGHSTNLRDDSNGEYSSSRWSRQKSSALSQGLGSGEESLTSGGSADSLEAASSWRRKRRRARKSAFGDGGTSRAGGYMKDEAQSTASFGSSYSGMKSRSSRFRSSARRSSTKASSVDNYRGQDTSAGSRGPYRRKREGTSIAGQSDVGAGSELDSLIDELSGTKHSTDSLTHGLGTSGTDNAAGQEDSEDSGSFTSKRSSFSLSSSSTAAHSLRQADTDQEKEASAGADESGSSSGDGEESTSGISREHHSSTSPVDRNVDSEGASTNNNIRGSRSASSSKVVPDEDGGSSSSSTGSVASGDEAQQASMATRSVDDGSDESEASVKLSASKKSNADDASSFLVPGLPELSSDQDPKSKKAFVSLLYYGTRRDYEYFVGLRVTFHTIKATGTSADLVALAGPRVPASWISTLVADGVRVVQTPNMGNPYNASTAYNPRFRFVMNKLLAWGLTEYTRVVLLDADNLVLQNIDELFLCGDFCAVFINPCIPHTGLVVLKPSKKKLRKLLRKLQTLPSFDAADQGFLCSFFPGLLGSPLYEAPPNDTLASGKLRPLRGLYRLPMGYQMDAIYYNLKFKWEVPCSENKVITFPGVSALKPWYWWSWPVFPLPLQWHATRLATIGYSWEFGIAVGLCILWLLVILSSSCSWRRTESGRPPSPKAPVTLCWMRLPSPALMFPRLYSALRQAGSWLWTLLTCASVPAAGLAAFSVVPSTVHPVAGWGLFFLGTFALLKLVRVVSGAPRAIYWLPTYLVFSLVVMALPVYSALGFKLLVFHLLAFGGGLVVVCFYLELSSHGKGRTSKSDVERARAE